MIALPATPNDTSPDSLPPSSSPPEKTASGRIKWTPAKVAQLKALAAEGPAAPSMREMGVILFGTELARNAVAGKMHRLGLCNQLTAEQRAMRHCSRYRGERPRRQVRPRKKLATLDGTAVRSEPYVALECVPPDPQFMCTLDDLGPLYARDVANVKCRAPVGDPGTPEFRFCGTPGATLPGPYCTFHNRMFYQSGTAVTRRRGSIRLDGVEGEPTTLRTPVLEYSEFKPGTTIPQQVEHG